MVFLDASIDTGLVSEVIGVAKSVMGLFKEFPINVILIGTVAGIAFKLIRGAKHTAG